MKLYLKKNKKKILDFLLKTDNILRKIYIPNAFPTFLPQVESALEKCFTIRS
jgi:hypothetical protein